MNEFKNLIIVCEGPTEKEFCNTILSPYFTSHKIAIHPPLIKKTGGGIVNWEALKHQITTHLKQEKTCFVTTLIDYYGINTNHKYPEWAQAMNLSDIYQRMSHLENAMITSIDTDLQSRFIPYLQLHEFEALLFSDEIVLEKEIKDTKRITELRKIVAEYPNPEMINNNKTTAPSKRLENLILGYSKPIMGILLAEEIGLLTMRKKCQHFHEWIIRIETSLLK